MKLFAKAALAAALVAASAGANASTFNFTYTFTDNQVLSGSLDGTLNGTSITDISNLQVAFDGTAFAGGLDASNNPTQLGIYGYDPGTQAFGTVPPVFSTISSQNNFSIQDIAPSVGFTNYQFTFVNDSSGPTVLASNFNFPDANDAQLGIDGPSLGAWTVTAAPVPLPAALPLLASGLGLFGFARRRRAV